jgi:hypothetical protein
MTTLVALIDQSNLDTTRISFSPKRLDDAGNGTTAVDSLDIHSVSEGCHSVLSGCESFTDRVLSFLAAHYG